MRKNAIVAALVALSTLVAVPACAQEVAPAISIRAGIPTDFLVNIVELYDYGLAIEAGMAWQVLDWLYLGWLAGYGFGDAADGAPVPAINHSAWVAARIGFGSLDGFKAALVLGIVWYPLGETTPIIPDIGVELGWGPVSIGLTTGSVSVGVDFRF